MRTAGTGEKTSCTSRSFLRQGHNRSFKVRTKSNDEDEYPPGHHKATDGKFNKTISEWCDKVASEGLMEGDRAGFPVAAG